MKRKLVCGLMSALFLVSLAACAGPGDGPKANATDKPGSAVGNTPDVIVENTPEPSADPVFVPMDEPEYELSGAYTTVYKGMLTGTNQEMSSNKVMLVAELKNTGDSDLFLFRGAYELTDSAGNVLKRGSAFTSYPNVISPGETAYMYEVVPYDGDADEELTLSVTPLVKEAVVENIRFDVTDFEIRDVKYGSVAATGYVENTSDVVAGNGTYVSVILKDADGKVMGRLLAIVKDDLAPGERAAFEASEMVLPEEVKTANIASYEVVAYPLQEQSLRA